MTVHWTHNAMGHLRSIHDYIAIDSPRHAKRTVDQITHKTRILATRPRLGPMVHEYQDDSVRELLYKSYRIIYRTLPDRVDIVAVIHAARVLPSDPP